MQKLLVLLLLAACSAAPSKNNYPQNWFQPVDQSTAASWEILPQEAGPGEVIVSKRNELGILSNFAATPFTYGGRTYASVEGFWQSLKYPQSTDDPRFHGEKIVWPHRREEVAAMTAFDAKHAGDQANQIMKKFGVDDVIFAGKVIPYHRNEKGEFYQLILAAERAKLEQNPEVQKVLLKTGNLILKPDHHVEPDAAPAWNYCQIWMDLRSELQHQTNEGKHE